MDHSPRAVRACGKGFKLGVKEEGNKTRLTRDEPGGIIIGLGLRQGAQLKCIYTNACSLGSKEEELQAIMW